MRHSSQSWGGMQSSSVKAIRSPRERLIPSLRAQLGPRRSLSKTMTTSSGGLVCLLSASRQDLMVFRPSVGTTTEPVCRSTPMDFMLRNSTGLDGVFLKRGNVDRDGMQVNAHGLDAPGMVAILVINDLLVQ